MAVIAEFVLQSRTFRMGSAFADLDGAEMELERVVPLETSVVPYLWIRGVSPEEVVRTVGQDDAVRRIHEIDSLPGQGHLFHVEWDRGVQDAVANLADAELVLLSGHGDAKEWRIEFWAERRDAVTEFRRFCTERHIDADLVRLTELRKTEVGPRYGLTQKQYETLVLAFERGYFDEPRRAELQDIADLLGVSRQSVAGRLRRGHRNLITGALLWNHELPVGGGDGDERDR